MARGQEFRDLAKDIAMQVAAMKPTYVAVEEIPSSVIEKEKEIALEQLNENQKKNADRILQGKLEKFYEETVLMCQVFIKDETGKKSIKDIVDALSAKCGEKLTVRRFQRIEVGEGIEKAANDFVAEVAAMTQN